MDLPTRGLKIWIAWGAVVSVLLISFPIIFGIYFTREMTRYRACVSEDSQKADCTEGVLWSLFQELDDTATGRDNIHTSQYIDTQSNENSGRITSNGTFLEDGEACGANFGYCGSGLVCAKNTEDALIGICRTSSETSPFILSLKLEGMALDQGVYTGTAGDDVRVVVQTIHGEIAEASVDGQSVSLTRGDDGKFTGVYTLPTDLQDLFLVVVRNGLETASMAVPVMSVK